MDTDYTIQIASRMAEIERENKFFFSSQISLGELIQEIKKA